MSRGRHIAAETGSGRVSWGVLGLAMGLFLAVSIPAGAAVERYQFTDYTIEVETVNGSSAFTHTFYLTHNPCTDTFSGYGVNHYHSNTNETLSNITMNGNTISFRANYDFNTYYWEPGFTLNEGGSFTWAGTTAGEVNTATGKWSSSQTSYNHGEYVAESIDDYGPDARSCIGKPIVSKSR